MMDQEVRFIQQPALVPILEQKDKQNVVHAHNRSLLTIKDVDQAHIPEQGQTLKTGSFQKAKHQKVQKFIYLKFLKGKVILNCLIQVASTQSVSGGLCAKGHRRV